MFVRVNKVDGVLDDTGGKGGWWTVEPDIPDEGRPGRKTKSKKRTATIDESMENGSVAESSVGDDEKWGKNGREGSLASTRSGKGSLRISSMPTPR